MGFFLALLSYLATLAAAVVLIAASVSYVVPNLPRSLRPTVVSAQKAAKPYKPSLRAETRRMAERAAARL